MDLKEEEEQRNDTATDDTVAWNKKRGRRVSFAAEMTSVHVFDRDEDLETPPEPKHESDTADEGLRFKDLEDSDDSRERNDGENREDDMFGRQPFLQPFESPSPGSAFGSAASNDEDDFFGPVSSEFIRPGRLSDSVASDDNHEITMDSTAFSMHFRSLAMSESGDLKTPTGSRLVFEEKTPTQSGATTIQGSSMELTGHEKSVPHISIPVDKFCSGKDSNDMSLVEENPRKYDYANISPRLDELVSDGNRFLHAIFTSESSDAINATNYSEKKSGTTWILTGGNSSKDDQAADLGNPRVHDSATASFRGREELLASSHTSVHLLNSDSLLCHEGVTERPSENKNQSSSQHNSVTEITEDHDLNGVDAQMPSIRSGKPSELSCPVSSFGLSTQKERRHFHSQGDMLKQSETTHANDISYQNFQSHSPAIPYPITLVEQPEDSHGEGRHGSDTVHSTSMHYQSPSVAITPLVSAMKAQLAMDVGNSPGQLKITPSEKLGGSLLNQEGTGTDGRYASEKKIIPRLKPDGVSSLSITPVVGDTSIRSKLSSCIVKTQHDMPVSRLEDRFPGIDQGKSVQKRTADVFYNELVPSEKLVNQERTGTDGRYASEKKIIPRLKLDGVSSISITPVFGDSSIRSKLSSCIVKTPQHAMPVFRLEDQFVGIDQGRNVQKMTSDVDENEFMTPRDRKDLPIVDVVKDMATKGLSSQLTTHVEEEPNRLSTLRITPSVLSDKKLTRTPDRMVYSQNRSLVPGILPHHNDSSPNELPGSSSFKILYDNTDKSNDTLEKILPSQKSSVFRSPSTRYKDTLHVELTRHTHSDEAIRMSPGNDGDSMEIMSSGNYLNVVAQKLDNLFTEQILYSRSPLFLIDHLKSPLQAHSLLIGDTNGVLHDAGILQTPLKNETILSSNGHASADESPLMVRTVTKESLLGTFENNVMHVQAPESSVHKRRRDELVTGSEHSTPNVDNPRSPKIQKKGVTESVKQNCFDDDQSERGSIVTLKPWPAILSEALTDSEQLLPTSVKRLDLRKIEMLEDVLTQLQKVHSVSRICSSIQTQSVRNHYNVARNRRISETKELLQKMLYEQAKLKLLRAKREKLLKKVEIIRSSIQDCQTMKLNCSQLPECVKCNTKAGNSDPQSLTALFEDQQNVQVADKEILKMRQQVGAAQRDIDSLIYSFHTCFKMKEKSTNVDTITLINDHLKRRALYKSLREGVQLWEINDVVNKKGQNQISLNYHGYFIQRFTLVAPISTVTVSYMLSHPNIEKNYPSMDAPNAFSFVFKVDVEQKYVGIRSLAQETQVTSSVLSSLLDVIEEVKLARLELKQLKEARFLSTSAERLDLCLHFFDFKTGTKVNMALDVSCLTRGIYPSDALPAQLQPHPLLSKAPLPTGLLAAVEKLKFGFSRIIRICRCISEALACPSYCISPRQGSLCSV